MPADFSTKIIWHRIEAGNIWHRIEAGAAKSAVANKTVSPESSWPRASGVFLFYFCRINPREMMSWYQDIYYFLFKHITAMYKYEQIYFIYFRFFMLIVI